jgi:hypothetical protein
MLLEPARSLERERRAVFVEPLDLRAPMVTDAVPIAESQVDVPAPDLQLDAPEIDLGP